MFRVGGPALGKSRTPQARGARARAGCEPRPPDSATRGMANEVIVGSAISSGTSRKIRGLCLSLPGFVIGPASSILCAQVGSAAPHEHELVLRTLEPRLESRMQDVRLIKR
jgi:hypothetical protein